LFRDALPEVGGLYVMGIDLEGLVDRLLRLVQTAGVERPLGATQVGDQLSKGYVRSCHRVWPHGSVEVCTMRARARPPANGPHSAA
jgi:hypothetical protein